MFARKNVPIYKKKFNSVEVFSATTVFFVRVCSGASVQIVVCKSGEKTPPNSDRRKNVCYQNIRNKVHIKVTLESRRKSNVT